MHQMHLVKLGVNKGVRSWDPQGCAWVRKSTEGNVLHRQNAGDQVPLALRQKKLRYNAPSVSSLTPKAALSQVHMTDVMNSCNMEDPSLAARRCLPAGYRFVSQRPPEGPNPKANTLIDGILP